MKQPFEEQRGTAHVISWVTGTGAAGQLDDLGEETENWWTWETWAGRVLDGLEVAAGVPLGRQEEAGVDQGASCCQGYHLDEGWVEEKQERFENRVIVHQDDHVDHYQGRNAVVEAPLEVDQDNEDLMVAQEEVHHIVKGVDVDPVMASDYQSDCPPCACFASSC